jgi:hypothetical protein
MLQANILAKFRKACKINFAHAESLIKEIVRVRHRRINIEQPTGSCYTDCIIVVMLIGEKEMCTNEPNLPETQLAETEGAKIARELLIEEYKGADEWGRHWDLLRWNVSKFFLSIQTVFVIVALKGLYELVKTVKETNPPSAITLIDKPLVACGLIVLAFINISLCIIWWLRNTGIHAWHRASIERQKEIELDPRFGKTIAFFTRIIDRMNGREGHLAKNGSTGELECWGPPAVFSVLWIGIGIFAISFLSR